MQIVNPNQVLQIAWQPEGRRLEKAKAVERVAERKMKKEAGQLAGKWHRLPGLAKRSAVPSMASLVVSAIIAIVRSKLYIVAG